MEAKITYETAKLAKEHGFKLKYCDTLYNGREITEMSCDSNFVKDRDWYLAPSQTVLREWLRMDHFIHIVVVPYGFMGGGEDLINHDDSYSYFVYDNTDYITDGVDFQTYEDALELALREAIKLVTEENHKIVE